MNLVKRIVLAAAGGYVLHLAFPFIGVFVAAPVGLALLWWAIEELRFRGAFAIGLLFGMTFFLPHLWWANALVGPIPWVLLALLESLFLATAVGLFAMVQRTEVLSKVPFVEPLVFALLWVAAELLRSAMPYGGFPWAMLAWSTLDTPVANLAWVGGPTLVSLAVAAMGGFVGLAWEAARARRVVLPGIALVASGAIAVAGFAVPLDNTAQTGHLRVGVVQGSLPDIGIAAFDQLHLVTENHVAESYVLAETAPWTPDVVLWPEAAVSVDPRVHGPSAASITAVARELRAPILLGTDDYSPEDGRYNVSLLWTEDGEVIDSYIKQHPAPFAEYLPLRWLALRLVPEAARVSVDMLPGEEVATVVLPSERLERDVILGDIICFEVAYNDVVRGAVDGGAEVLVVQTNNAQFRRTALSEQQFAMTRLRAIETGRATLQVSTTGVSGVVWPDGSVYDKTEFFEPAHIAAELPLRDGQTPAMRLGMVFDVGVLVAAALLLAGLAFRAMRGRWDWE